MALVSRARVSAWVALLLLASAAPATAQGPAVVVHTDTEQVPLTVYAEMRGSGMLGLSSGSLREIPTVASFRLVRTNLTGWQPARAIVATEAFFASEYAERRLLPASFRRVGVTAIEMRVSDLESPARVQELLTAGRQRAHPWVLLRHPHRRWHDALLSVSHGGAALNHAARSRPCSGERAARRRLAAFEGARQFETHVESCPSTRYRPPAAADFSLRTFDV